MISGPEAVGVICLGIVVFWAIWLFVLGIVGILDWLDGWIHKRQSRRRDLRR